MENLEKTIVLGANCRLCANYHKVSTLYNLNEDKKKFEELKSILCFLNANYVDFSINGLSLAVCTDCYQSMVQIFKFLCKVQYAQHKLKGVKPGEICSTSKEVPDLLGKNTSAIEVKSEQYNFDPSMEIEIKIERAENADNSQNPFENINEHLESNTPFDFLKVEYASKGSKNQNDKIKNEERENSTKSDNLKMFILKDNDGKPDKLIKLMPLKSKPPTGLIRKVALKSSTQISYKSEPDKSTENKKEIPNSVEKNETDKKSSEMYDPKLKRCETCNITFKYRQAYYKHRVDEHGLQRSRKIRPKGAPLTIEDMTCEYCSKVFTKRNNLFSHISMTHKRKKHNLVCETCGKTYQNKDYFRLHVKSHGSNAHVCKICSASYIEFSRFKDHLLTHSEEKTFSCPYCDGKFKTNRLLKIHVRSIHTHPKTFDCGFCGKRFKSKGGRVAHERGHTGEYLECEPCGMKFTTRGNCDKHMRARHNTTLYKYKYTPQGKMPIDPTTGEAIQLSVQPELQQWKKQVLTTPPLKCGKSKCNPSPPLKVKKPKSNPNQVHFVNFEELTSVERDT